MYMVGKIKVGKVSKPSTTHFNVRVDRQSALGNPFAMKQEADRDIVCDAYQAHLLHKIKTKDKLIVGELTHIYGLVMAGHDVQLNCWCAPKRCHADLIKRTVEKAVEKANA